MLTSLLPFSDSLNLLTSPFLLALIILSETTKALKVSIH